MIEPNDQSDINKLMIAFRRHIHQHPELSFQEVQTAAYIKSILSDAGIRIEPFGVHNSFAAIVQGKADGPNIGLRAELDALPITESTGLEFASAHNGVMHACGHDLHMAIAMGITLSLNKIVDKLNGRFIAIFQSGEEQLPGGALAITQTELFKKLNFQSLFAVHVLPELGVGKIGVCSGRYMASGDEIYLTVKGKGGHAALPHLLIDPVICAAQILVNLQTLVSRKTPSLIPTVLSFGSVNALGATNIIPNEVSISGTFRTMDEEWRTKAHQLITQIAQNTAESQGASCQVDIKKGYPSIYNNPDLVNLLTTCAIREIGQKNVVSLPPRMTTDDFAYFSNRVPSVLFRIGSGNGEVNEPQLHRPDFNPSESAMGTAYRVLLSFFKEIFIKPDVNPNKT